MEDLVYTIPQVAKLLKTDKQRTYRLVEKKLLVALKLGSLKVSRNELIRFLSKYSGKDLSDLDNIKDL